MGMIMAIETDNRGGGEREAVDYFYELPEGCIAHIVSLTSPRDACRLCLVSSVFRSAAESDAVWERFLPPEYPSIVSPHSRPCPSKKHLFFSLCDTPLLIDQGTMSFSLEKVSGKKCYMISARALFIVWGDSPSYWRWIPLPEARFEDVAELIMVCWFEIRGKIDIQMLSPSTLYTVNLVFKSNIDAYGFEHQPVEATIGLVGGETTTRSVYLDSERGHRMSYASDIPSALLIEHDHGGCDAAMLRAHEPLSFSSLFL
ncbi:hypothetical protein TIFTF001_001127 [Ficus carica]|uniref:F-box domain-containing protein n=1 Tax=Ficus carica TaxID=3494 RepID=A0AA87YYJ7_FICCA|nr:hypothetical protein TIFTF001_001127 [Ficus carica]